VTEVAIVVGGALPDADRAQVRRLERRDLPLVHRVVGDAVQSDLAGAPRLPRRPLDAVVEVLGFARRPDVEMTGGAAGAARVDPDAGVAVRHPLLRVDDLPVLIFVRGPGRDVRVMLGHPAPLIGVEILEVEPLAVRAVREDDRVLARSEWPEDVGAEDQAVVDADRGIPVDAHPVARFAGDLAHAPADDRPEISSARGRRGRGRSRTSPSCRPPRLGPASPGRGRRWDRAGFQPPRESKAGW